MITLNHSLFVCLHYDCNFTMSYYNSIVASMHAYIPCVCLNIFQITERV